MTLVDDESTSAPTKRRQSIYAIETVCDWILKVAGLAAAILFGIWAPISYTATKEGNASNDEAQSMLLKELKTMTQIQVSLIAEIKSMSKKISEMNEEVKNVKETLSDAHKAEVKRFGEVGYRRDACYSHLDRSSKVIEEFASQTIENAKITIPNGSATATAVLPVPTSGIIIQGTRSSVTISTSVYIDSLATYNAGTIPTTSKPGYESTSTHLLDLERDSIPTTLTFHNGTSRFRPPGMNGEWKQMRDVISNSGVGMAIASLYLLTMYMCAVRLKRHRTGTRDQGK
jgi:hypothetical protein